MGSVPFSGPLEFLRREQKIVRDCDADWISWPEWLTLYRVLLADLAEFFGLPGEIEPSGIEVEMKRGKDAD